MNADFSTILKSSKIGKLVIEIEKDFFDKCFTVCAYAQKYIRSQKSYWIDPLNMQTRKF